MSEQTSLLEQLQFNEKGMITKYFKYELRVQLKDLIYECEPCAHYGINTPEYNLFYGKRPYREFEEYIRTHSTPREQEYLLRFTRSICPDCVESLWDEFFEKEIPVAMRKWFKIQDIEPDFSKVQKLIETNPILKATIQVLLHFSENEDKK
ncbi:MAG: hypothetical protein ACFFD2_00425 [Promethearchaeota archaeon]